MSEKHYPYYGGAFDRIIFDKDESVWVPEVKLQDVESENASLIGAAKGLGELCDRYKSDNEKLRELVRTIWLAGDFRAFLGVGELEVRMRELGIEAPDD